MREGRRDLMEQFGEMEKKKENYEGSGEETGQRWD